MFRRIGLVGSSLLVVALLAPGVRSQTVPADNTSPAASPTSAASEAPSAAAPSTAPASSGGGDIVVTAQRRSERLVDVPVSISVVPGAQLSQGGASIEAATKLVPGVVIARNGLAIQPTIRGIGTNVSGVGVDPNVAIYLDGVYQSSQAGNIFDLVNVDQVQILKGPQGTLFGRNATGGAILVTTKAPSFTPTAEFNLSYARYNEVTANAYGSTGIGDKVAVDLAVYYRHSDGWMRDLRTGQDVNEQRSYDVRSKILFEPTDKLKFTLGLSHSYTSDPTGFAFEALNGDSIGRPRPGSTPIAADRNELSQDTLPVIQIKANNIQLNGSYDLGFATLASITDYRTERDHFVADLDSSYAPVQYESYTPHYRDFSQEVTLTSPSHGKFTWVAGAYYFHEKAYISDFYLNGSSYIDSDVHTDAVAGFADGTYNIGRLALIGGIRFSSEQKQFAADRPSTGASVADKTRWNSWTPRAGLRFTLSPHANIYATYSKGFKSGAYNPTSLDTKPINPEKVDAYEIGFKSSTRLLSINLAAFYYNYNDIQVSAYDFSVGTQRLFNAARAKIYGAEADAAYHVTDALDVHAAFAYTHSEYSSFPGAPQFLPAPPGNVGNVSTSGGIDASGNAMIRAPKFTVSGTASYKIDLPKGSVTISATPYWSSRVYYTFDERLSQAPYFTMDARIAWAPTDRLTLSVFGRNLTDKTYATYITASQARDGVQFARPRTFGVALGFKY
nr:TonB-dependent receptor [Sphingomonas chungangi]